MGKISKWMFHYFCEKDGLLLWLPVGPVVTSWTVRVSVMPPNCIGNFHSSTFVVFAFASFVIFGRLVLTRVRSVDVEFLK